jgi:hypothetical protein
MWNNNKYPTSLYIYLTWTQNDDSDFWKRLEPTVSLPYCPTCVKYCFCDIIINLIKISRISFPRSKLEFIFIPSEHN